MLSATGELAESEGIIVCPEGADAVPGLKELLEKAFLGLDWSVVLFKTGSGPRYPEIL